MIGGGITIRLPRDGRAEIVNRRTVLPRALVCGKPPAEIVRLLPRLFAVCAYAHGSAAASACETAMGAAADPAQDGCRRFLVAAEAVREHLQRLILGAAETLREAPEPAALAPLRRLTRSLRACGNAEDIESRSGNAREVAAVLGQLAAANIHGETADTDGFLAWAAAGRSAPARLCRMLVDRPAAADLEVAALPDIQSAALAERLLGPDGEVFAALPTWDGRAFETTAFTRQRRTPLVAGLEARFGDGILTRLAARQVEIASLSVQLSGLAAAYTLADGAPFALAAAGQDDGVGVSQIETARGRLIHAVRLRDGRVADYRILAPTEWNFHPDGPVAARLSRLIRSHLTGGVESGLDDDLQRRARLLIEAFDPCVDYRLTVQ